MKRSFLTLCPGRRLTAVTALVFFTLSAAAADTARRGASETALDRYIAQHDDAFSWQKVAEARDEGATVYAIDLVSQRWLTPAEVSRPEWRHWLLIVKPEVVEQRRRCCSSQVGATGPAASRRDPPGRFSKSRSRPGRRWRSCG